MHVGRAGGTAKGIVVLSATTDVVKRFNVIGLYAVKLGDGQIAKVAPGGATIPTFVNTTVTTNVEVLRIIGINPQRVVVDMSPLT